MGFCNLNVTLYLVERGSSENCLTVNYFASI